MTMTTIKAPPKIGDRVRLVAAVPDEYPPPGLPAGLEGTVDWVGQWTNEYTRQVGVKWDNNRRLILLDGDQFEVIS
jgi:hypothetical protein